MTNTSQEQPKIEKLQASSIQHDVFQNDIPRVDPETGIYTDPNGGEWMSAKPLARKLGFSNYNVILHAGILSIVGIGRQGYEATLYNTQEALELFKDRIGLTRVNEENGIYEDTEGKKWMSANRFSNDFNIPFNRIKSLIKDIPSLKGINRSIVDLYPLDALLDIFSDYMELPAVDKDTNIYTDSKDGTQWAPVKYFTDAYSLVHETVTNYFKRDNVPTKKGRERSGKKVDLFLITIGESSLEKLASLPQAGADGCYRDESGITWVPLAAFKSYCDIDVSTIKNLLTDSPTMMCRTSRKVPTVFYPLDAGIKKIEQYTSVPKIDREIDYYEDSHGEHWATIRYFRNKYGIGASTFQSYAGHVKALDGRKQGSGVTKLYNLEEAEQALQPFFLLMAVDKETGRVKDKHGIIWTTDNGFCASHGVSYMKVHSMLDGVPTCEGRGANGMKSALYRLDVLEEKFKDFLSLPVVDKKTGIYRDDSGKEWASLKSIAKINGVTSTKLEGYVSHIATIRGRDRTGGESLLYSVDEFSDILCGYTALPMTDTRTGIYTDNEGNQWMPLRPLADRLGIGEVLLKTFENITNIQGRDKLGRETTLLNIRDVESAVRVFQILPLVDRSGIYIDSDGIEWQQIDKAAVRFSFSRNTLERRNVEQCYGRTKRNFKIKLCRVADIETLLEERSSAKIIASQEQSVFPHAILGKKYQFNEISFTVLGIEPLFFTSSDEKAVANTRGQRQAIIPFQGGWARITKIRIGDEVVVGSLEILKRIVSQKNAPDGWRTIKGLIQECCDSEVAIKHHADYYRPSHPEWFEKYVAHNGRMCEHYSPQLCDLIRQAVKDKRS